MVPVLYVEHSTVGAFDAPTQNTIKYYTDCAHIQGKYMYTAYKYTCTLEENSAHQPTDTELGMYKYTDSVHTHGIKTEQCTCTNEVHVQSVHTKYM